jgi:sugar O-acyltransferase (sialic acid O-acetyltransferase NeuD family)
MRIVILGAGGHARSVIEALRTGHPELEPVACTDPDPGRAGTALDGIPVVGDDDHLAQLLVEGVEGAVLGVGGAGSNDPRRLIYERARAMGFQLPPIAHADATVAATARVGFGTQILAGAIVGAGARIGENVIVNSGAIVEHDCLIGDHVHLATGSALAGAVRVEPGAHVGLAASVLQSVTVGAWSVVGAGAVVIRDVAPREVVVGCPASTLKPSG